jgi:hypothetical protein
MLLLFYLKSLEAKMLNPLALAAVALGLIAPAHAHDYSAI